MTRNSRKKRIRASKQPDRKLRALEIVGDGDLHFCFKYLDTTHEKFRLSECSAGFLCPALERIRDLSSLKAVELYTNRSRALRAHPITWAETSEPSGFQIPAHLREADAYQISVSQGNGRIHGFRVDDFFFVVWLDPEHALYQ